MKNERNIYIIYSENHFTERNKNAVKVNLILCLFFSNDFCPVKKYLSHCVIAI